MKSAVAKKDIELALSDRFGAVFQRRQKQRTEMVPTGIRDIDACLNGFPRGAITEIHGTASSGRTSLLLSALAFATSEGETCALVDTSDTFDLSSAANARIDCDRLLWVRCSSSIERAFKATDLLLQSGGFGLVALNLADVSAKNARRIITSWWFRFRRSIENTPTVLVVLTPVACTRSCAALVLEVKNEGPIWLDTGSFVLGNDGPKLTSEPSKHRLSLISRSGPPVPPQASEGKKTWASPTPPACPSLGVEKSFLGSPSSSPLPYSNLLQGIRVRVDQERPVTWIAGPARFRTRLH